jgi:hypothetical protein
MGTMTEVLFDTEKGRIINPLLAHNRVQDTDIVVPLEHLLETQNFTYVLGDFQRPETEGWSRFRSVSVGKLALRALKTDEAPQPLRTRHMSRLAILGMIPVPDIYKKHFSDFYAYKRTIGSPIRYDRIRYADWTPPDYIDYARLTVEDLGREPAIADYDLKFDRQEGPSFARIQSVMGGIKKFHEHIGFPDISGWDKDDFVIWGIQVMKANPDIDISLPMIDILAERHRGPSVWTVYNRMPGGWSELKRKVSEEGSVQIAAEKVARARHMIQFDRLITEGRLVLPVPAERLTDAEKLRIYGRYTVAQNALPDSSVKELSGIACHERRSLVTMLQQAKDTLKPGYIEMLAVTDNVFEYIWPPEERTDCLRVTQDEIDVVVRNKTARELTRRRRKRAALQAEGSKARIDNTDRQLGR